MATESRDSSSPPEFAWEVATLYPVQGQWRVDDYLALTQSTNRLIELTQGRVEFLPMPTELHQAILEYLFDMIREFVRQRDLGQVRFAPLRVRVEKEKFREPDIVYLSREHFHLRGNAYWSGADLVVEVVSDDPAGSVRDYEIKRVDYAAAGIAEYWIVDPQTRRIIVLALDGAAYRIHGDFQPGDRATSNLLDGLVVDVAGVFDAGDAALG